MPAETMGLEDCIAAMTDAARVYAHRRADEMELEDMRPRVKRDAIQRLMGHDNPLTNKPHSASSAEAVVETDDIYSRHRAKQRDATVDTIIGRAAYDAARARLWATVRPTEDI